MCLDEERREGKYTLGWWYVCEVVVGVRRCSSKQIFTLFRNHGHGHGHAAAHVRIVCLGAGGASLANIGIVCLGAGGASVAALV